MNIILGEEKVKDLDSKYVVLTLDRFRISNQDKILQSYCVVENIPIPEIPQIESWKELHENLMINYSKKNWDFCEQAIEHLLGRWNGEVDSFYNDISRRVTEMKTNDPGPDWSPVINR